MADVNYTIILIAALVAVASPGPAALAIAEASMSKGRQFGAMLAFGITTGSMFWSVSAAVGLSALLMTQAWLFEWVRYLGVSYLLYLAWMSARSAWFPKAEPELSETPKFVSFKAASFRGLGIHLTIPKAILFFGSLYSLGIPLQTSVQQIEIANALIVTQGF